MSKPIYLHIPEPCHENWEQMSPAQKGRFCDSCAKQVIDFSSMSDQQILNVLSAAAGKTCGRFTADQLNRPFQKEIPFLLSPRKAIVATLLPVAIITGTASCQDKLTGKVAQKTEVVQLMGDTVMLMETPLSGVVRLK